MARSRPPRGYRPMDDLTEPGRDVVMRLPDGEVVIGRLALSCACGCRSFWRWRDGAWRQIAPVGWREIPPRVKAAAFLAARTAGEAA